MEVNSMSRFKLLVRTALGMLAVGAISSVTVASAQPTSTCTPNGGVKTLSMLCVQNNAGTLLVVGLPALETITVLGTKEAGTKEKEETEFLLNEETEKEVRLSITCTAVAMEGTFDGSPVASASIEAATFTFSGCAVTTPAHCALENNGFKTHSLTGTISNEDGDITFKPTTGGAFATFTVVNSGGTCTVAGAHNLEGQVLGLLSEPEVDKSLHTLAFVAATGLSVGAVPYTLTLSEDVILDTPSGWSGFPTTNILWGLFLTETSA
jgi:hypothetical protein